MAVCTQEQEQFSISAQCTFLKDYHKKYTQKNVTMNKNIFI